MGRRVLLVGSTTAAAIGYSWSLDDVSLRRRDTVRHLLLNLMPGYHTITFRDTFQTYGSDTLTCIDSIRRVNRIFVSNPVAVFNAAPVLGCTPLPVIFTSSSTFTPGAAATKIKWDYGDGGKDSGLANPVLHNYVTPGVYTVLLTVSDSNGCSSSQGRSAFIDARKITAAFSVNKTAACIGSSLQFAGNISTGGYPLRYTWYFGDGDSSKQDNPTHAYAATGNYTVRLIAVDSATGCTDTLTRLAYIFITKPHASLTISDTFGICAPMIDTFRSHVDRRGCLRMDFRRRQFFAAGKPDKYLCPARYFLRQTCCNRCRRVYRHIGHSERAYTWVCRRPCIQAAGRLRADDGILPGIGYKGAKPGLGFF